VHFAVESLRYAIPKPRKIRKGKSTKKRKQRRRISVCVRSTKCLWFYSVQVAVRRLEKRQKISNSYG